MKQRQQDGWTDGQREGGKERERKREGEQDVWRVLHSQTTLSDAASSGLDYIC